MDINQYHERLEGDGYVRGWARSAVALIDGQGIDMEVAAEATCPECDHVGMDYEAWGLPDDPSERISLAVCPECGDAHSF